MPADKPTLNGAKGLAIPTLTPEEEDQIVHARITNEERPLKRVLKRFHQYTNAAHPTALSLPSPNGPTGLNGSVEDAREAFLVELASFQLLLKKSAMICEAEARQVEEYQREKQRIDLEHNTLRGQIEQLKTALDEAQVTRKRKIEYDLIAEKVNTLPSREELERSIEDLENDLVTIHDEHESQTRAIQSQKVALDSIITDLGSLRFISGDPTTSLAPSQRGTPALDGEGAEDLETSQPSADTPVPSKGDEKEEGEEGEENPPEAETNGDIEMGEVEEDTRSSRTRKAREELEEGEATDASSELSEPPDDT
ncbi:hypothetical protein BT96DRAFT_984485 [Gymnopus androsaceus JB14]|uniref:Tho complex 7 n=1 Tax=Gymnopus androsaceus JB14 TaxID=1447944 RepID=A0A6A4IDA4_9AGAR|nr:hypothetical protein BT96DRAFT_984485 [Gymnopus androsaceus JB14]